MKAGLNDCLASESSSTELSRTHLPHVFYLSPSPLPDKDLLPLLNNKTIKDAFWFSGFYVQLIQPLTNHVSSAYASYRVFYAF